MDVERLNVSYILDRLDCDDVALTFWTPQSGQSFVGVGNASRSSRSYGVSIVGRKGKWTFCMTFKDDGELPVRLRFSDKDGLFDKIYESVSVAGDAGLLPGYMTTYEFIDDALMEINYALLININDDVRPKRLESVYEIKEISFFGKKRKTLSRR